MTSAARAVRVVHIGSYTEPPAGRGPGVTTAVLDLATGALTVSGEVAVPNPSYLLAHPTAPVVYAVDERDDGAVSVLRRGDDGHLALVDRHPTGSAGPCHLAMTPDLGHLLTAEYVGGGLSAFALEPDGTVLRRTDAVHHDLDPGLDRGGLGPDLERQDAPHVHMVVPEAGTGSADDETVVHAVDLGTDEIRTYGLDRDGRLLHEGTSRVTPGTGPRQLLRLPGDGRRYALAGELAGTLSVLERDGSGTFRTVTTRAATTTPAPDGVPTYPAHLDVGPAGHVLLSTRGPDVVTAVAVEGDALRTVAEVGTGGRWPRHFAVVERWVLVCDEFDDRVVVLAIDPGTGALRETDQRLAVGAPACVIAAP